MKSSFFLYVALIAIVISVLSSCENKLDQVTEKLTGKWFQSGSTIPERKYYQNKNGEWKEAFILKPNEVYRTHEDTCSFITFSNTTDYYVNSMCGDLHFNHRGKYYVHENPKRGLLTLMLLPDLDIHGTDTIRRGSQSMDIAVLNSDSLVLVEQTTVFERDTVSNTSSHFNFKKIYKRLK